MDESDNFGLTTEASQLRIHINGPSRLAASWTFWWLRFRQPQARKTWRTPMIRQKHSLAMLLNATGSNLVR